MMMNRGNGMEKAMKRQELKTDVSHLGDAEKIYLIHLLQEEINLLKEKNNRLEAKLKIITDRLLKDSSNSSKAPSSDESKSSRKKLILRSMINGLWGKDRRRRLSKLSLTERN